MQKEIAIFVSHRIDKPCYTPQCSLYHPVRCGAVYDKSDSSIPGDNTGKHISEKRMQYNELTVQYWAQKNYKADYYGLCHYRRYFSFSDTIFEQKRFNVVEKASIESSVLKYSLIDEEKIKKEIENVDAIIPYGIDVRTVLTGVPGGDRFYPHNIFEFWEAKTDQIDIECVKKLIEIVKADKPEYYPYLMEYINGTTFYGGCSYVLRRDLFEELCEFQFSTLELLTLKFDMSKYKGEHIRQPAFMGEILYGAFLTYLKHQNYKISEHQLVLFMNPNGETALPEAKTNKLPVKENKSSKAKKMTLLEQIKAVIKRIARNIMPAYRTSLRIETKVQQISALVMGSSDVATAKSLNKVPKPTVLQRTRWDRYTLTSNEFLTLMCFAQEIREEHHKSFEKYKDYYTGQDLAIVATGPSMAYYSQILNIPHIGVNAAFKNPNITLKYYFTTDYESRNDWFEDLKDYNFIKFFGQYSLGTYRDRFQVNEKLVRENHAFRFFQGAPSEDIHLNIEHYPLMGFYSIAFQALHFAVYTNPRRIYLVGCDCSNAGYFDGSSQLFANPPKWVTGYKKMKAFVERFYPETEIISINPVGLKGLFHDVYTENYLADHPEIDPTTCEILKID